MLLCLPVWGLSDVEKVVDPDNGGGTDYTSLNAWEDAFGGHTSGDGDLVGDDERAVALCRSSSGGDDELECVVGGWADVDDPRLPVIRGTDFPTDGVWDETKYIIHCNDDTKTAINWNAVDYGRVENIQIKVTMTAATKRYGIYCENITGGLHTIDSCFIKGVISGSEPAYALYTADPDSNWNVFNNIVTNFINGADSDFIGIRTSGDMNLFNNTVYDCYYGIRRSAGTTVLINCAVFNCTDDLDGAMTVTYTGTEDAAHAGAGNFQITQGDPWTDLVTNPAADNFSVKDASSELYQTGNGATPKALFTDDIIGVTRPQAPGSVDLDWDVGAYEYAAPAPTGGQVIMIQSAIPLVLIFTLVLLKGSKCRQK